MAQQSDEHIEKIEFAVLRLYINVGMGLRLVIGSLVYVVGKPFLPFVLNAILGILAVIAMRVWSQEHEGALRGTASPPTRSSAVGGTNSGSGASSSPSYPSQLAFALPSYGPVGVDPQPKAGTAYWRLPSR